MTRWVPAVMHVHTEWSHDGRDSLPAMADFAAREHLRWVFLTDHAEDFDETRFQTYTQACSDASTDNHELIAGLEFRFEGYPGLHLLALGLRQWIAPETPEDFCALAGRHAAFLIMAHPILTKYRAPEAVLGGVHAIEVWNARYNTRYLPDGRAVAFYKESQQGFPALLATAGTDQHNLLTEGKIRIVLPADGDPFESLRNGNYYNRGLTMRVANAPEWGQFRLALVALLRVAVERLKRWRARLDR